MVIRGFKRIFHYIKKADILLWLLVSAVSAYSLLLLRIVDSATGSGYFRTQLFAIGLGVAGAIVISLLDYVELANFWYLLAGFSVFLMIYTALFGEAVKGSGGVDARAWINISGFSFQSSEAVKIAFILTFAKHLDSLRKRGWIDRPLHVVLLAVHALVPMGLCEIQGDTGAAIVFFAMFVVMSLAAGVKLRYFAILGGLVLLALPLLWQFVMEDYQKLLQEARGHQLLYLDDMHDDSGEGYLERTVVSDSLDPLQALEDSNMRIALVRAIEALPEREKLMMALYYEQDLNLREIGEVMGVSESRVCQIHTQAVARLRAVLVGEQPSTPKAKRGRKPKSVVA